MGDQSPALVINPSDDAEFREAVQLALEASGGTTFGLQSVLRSQFPHVIVRARDLHGESMIIWYVYRDGHWRRPHAAREG